MEIKKLDAKYSYDYRLDVVRIEVKQKYKYEESIDFEVGVYLDFDENYFPVNLEIIDASKKIGVPKEFLINPDGDVKIVIDSDLIGLEVCFKNDSEEHVLKYSNRHDENFKIADLETTFALV